MLPNEVCPRDELTMGLCKTPKKEQDAKTAPLKSVETTLRLLTIM